MLIIDKKNKWSAVSISSWDKKFWPQHFFYIQHRVLLREFFLLFITFFIASPLKIRFSVQSVKFALPEWNEGCNHTKCFRCVLFRVMYTTIFFIATLLRIWLAVTVERVETATFNPRVENRSFNPLYRYRKSDFQRRRYEIDIRVSVPITADRKSRRLLN